MKCILKWCFDVMGLCDNVPPCLCSHFRCGLADVIQCFLFYFPRIPPVIHHIRFYPFKKTMLSSISVSQRGGVGMLCRQAVPLKAPALIRRCVTTRAVEGENPFTGSQAAESSASPKAPSPADSARAADEARLESAEKTARRARQQSAAPTTPRRQIPILGVDKPGGPDLLTYSAP